MFKTLTSIFTKIISLYPQLLNPIKLNIKQYLNLVVWGLKTSFWQLGHKSSAENHSPDFPENNTFYPEL